MRDLTPKQEQFVEGVISGLTQREAYKQAYPGINMNDNSIDQSACRLMKHPGVAHRVAELRGELKERHMATADKVIEELTHIAFADISDYLDYKKDGDNVKVEIKDSKNIDTRAVSEVSVTKDGTFKFKMYAKDQALIALGKHLGMFVDRSMNLNINAEESIRVSQALSNNPKLAAQAVELYRKSKQTGEVK